MGSLHAILLSTVVDPLANPRGSDFRHSDEGNFGEFYNVEETMTAVSSQQLVRIASNRRRTLM